MFVILIKTKKNEYAQLKKINVEIKMLTATNDHCRHMPTNF